MKKKIGVAGSVIAIAITSAVVVTNETTPETTTPQVESIEITNDGSIDWTEIEESIEISQEGSGSQGSEWIENEEKNEQDDEQIQTGEETETNEPGIEWTPSGEDAVEIIKPIELTPAQEIIWMTPLTPAEEIIPLTKINSAITFDCADSSSSYAAKAVTFPISYISIEGIDLAGSACAPHNESIGRAIVGLANNSSLSLSTFVGLKGTISGDNFSDSVSFGSNLTDFVEKYTVVTTERVGTTTTKVMTVKINTSGWTSNDFTLYFSRGGNTSFTETETITKTTYKDVETISYDFEGMGKFISDIAFQ